MKSAFIPFLLFTIVVKGQDINSDLLIHLPVSGNIEDVTGNSNLVLSGTEILSEDRFGNLDCAVKFTGFNNEYINIAQNANNAWQYGDPITISLWFKPLNVVPGDFEVLFASGETNWGEGFGLALYDVNTPLAIANDWQNWDNDWNNDVPLYTDTLNWHHLVITVDDQYNSVLYRDNIIRNSSNISTKNILPNIAFDYVIGQSYKGALDDVRVYKRALTASEIDLLFLQESTCEMANILSETTYSFESTAIFPNPAQDYIQIEIPDNVQTDITIYSLNGLIVKRIPNYSSRSKINITDLSKGMYFINIETVNSLPITHKLVIN